MCLPSREMVIRRCSPVRAKADVCRYRPASRCKSYKCRRWATRNPGNNRVDGGQAGFAANVEE